MNHLRIKRTLATVLATMQVQFYSASLCVLALATPSFTRQTVGPGDRARQLPSLHASPWLMLLFDCHGNQNGTCRHGPGSVHRVPATTRSRRFIMACRHPWRTTGPCVCFNKAHDGCRLACSRRGKRNVKSQPSLGEKAVRKTIRKGRASA